MSPAAFQPSCGAAACPTADASCESAGVTPDKAVKYPTAAAPWLAWRRYRGSPCVKATTALWARCISMIGMTMMISIEIASAAARGQLVFEKNSSQRMRPIICVPGPPSRHHTGRSPRAGSRSGLRSRGIERSTSSTALISPSVTTNYTVNGTSSFGCPATTTITQVVASCTGINSLSYEKSVSLFPNPNNGEFSLNIEFSINNGEIELRNVLGQIVFSEEEKILNAHFLKKIDARGFSPGLYILSVKTDHVTVNKKLISNH